MTVVGAIPADTSAHEPRPVRAAFDASNLPSVVYGSRVVTWWGTVGFMITESATVAACLVAYYYVQRNFTTWPPLRTPPPDLFIPSIGLIVLIAAMIPKRIFQQAAKRLDRDATIKWMWIAAVMMLAATALRLLEFRALNVRWDANAYGSVAWAVVVAHFTLLLVDTIETIVFVIMVQRDAPSRYYPGVAEDAFYSYFMTALWIPCFVTVYLVPRWI